MRPVVRIGIAGRDVAKDIEGGLLSLTITDESGAKADTAELRIADPHGRWLPPAAGTVMSVGLGYEEALVDLGRYTINETGLSGPPDAITVRAAAADFTEGLKQKREVAWDNVTLADIVAKIAGRYGLTPAVNPDLADFTYPHVDQTESDLNFLTRLAKKHKAIAKPVDRHLVVTLKGDAVAVTGRAMPARSIAAQDIVSWRLTQAERGQFKAAKTFWLDQATSRVEQVLVGDEAGPVQEDKTLHESRTAAKAVAQALLKSTAQIILGKLSLTIPGDPHVQAETPIDLTHPRPVLTGRWVVSRAVHRMDNSGFVTEIEAARGQD